MPVTPVSGAPALVASPLDGFTTGAGLHHETKPRMNAMAKMKAVWNDLVARFPEFYSVVAQLPDTREDDVLLNAHSAQKLMVRLIRKLPTQGEFAIRVSRQSGQRQIICGFGDRSDAALVANVTKASSSGRTSCFVLDETAEQELFKIAGPGATHRRVRTTLQEPNS